MIKQTLSLKKACFIEEKEKNTDYSEVFQGGIHFRLATKWPA